MPAEPVIVEEYGSTLEVFPLPTDQATLQELLTGLFEQWWEQITFGTLVQGAAWEIAAPNPPKRIGLYDGYLTVDFGAWHFHLCIGEHTGSGPELGRIRRCREAFLYRSLDPAGSPVSWGLRLVNGEGTQLATMMLPNPFLSHRGRILDEPEWSHLACWDEIRLRFLGLGPDPRDRLASGFSHS